MIWYDMIWYDMIWYDMIWYDMIWFDMIWYDMIWYDVHKCGGGKDSKVLYDDNDTDISDILVLQLP